MLPSTTGALSTDPVRRHRGRLDVPSVPAVFSARRADDADLIRARLRALLDDGRTGGGWLPDGADEEEGDDWTVPPRRHLAVVPDPSPGRPEDRVAVRQAGSAGREAQGAGGGAHQAGRGGSGPVDLDPAVLRTVRLGPVAPPTGRGGGLCRAEAADDRRGRRDEDRRDEDRRDDDHWDDDHDSDPDAAAGRHRAAGAAVRVAPGRTSVRALWVVALVAALAVGGWSWLSRPTVTPVPATVVAAGQTGGGPLGAASPSAASPTAGPSAGPAIVVVAVVGQVATPGLVTLPVGSRVADAVAAAGGLLPGADAAGFNAAALLSDGQQVAIGVPGVPAPVPGGTAAPGAPVNLNTATVADLDQLPGIGPVLAQRIVDYRTVSGPFASVDQLEEVSGIGPALYAEVSPLVTV